VYVLYRPVEPPGVLRRVNTEPLIGGVSSRGFPVDREVRVFMRFT